MNKELTEFIKDLIHQINETSRAAYGDPAFERWQKPLYMRAMDNADGYACLSGACDDSMQFFLKLKDNHIQDASFLCNGCGVSVACGSVAAELALGKTPDAVQRISAEAILENLGGLPVQETHSAFLAAPALHAALQDWMTKNHSFKPESQI